MKINRICKLNKKIQSSLVVDSMTNVHKNIPIHLCSRSYSNDCIFFFLVLVFGEWILSWWCYKKPFNFGKIIFGSTNIAWWIIEKINNEKPVGIHHLGRIRTETSFQRVAIVKDADFDEFSKLMCTILARNTMRSFSMSICSFEMGHLRLNRLKIVEIFKI